ncbi:MAG: EF-P lysine aminoacylase GenX [Nevskiales bacterium]|nr:EF-P lysine aminoacylase GenX [Nevskiales bacterium]
MQRAGEGQNWRPTASLETLRARAQLLSRLRTFFAERGVLEVDTPALSHHATVNRHIESFFVSSPSPVSRLPSPIFLHTSPEFAMKRLLAAGSGPIFQLCHVFRAGESGRWHNPEFLMLEWYRPGWDYHRLMDEVESLLAATGGPPVCERLTYREAFQREAGFDPFTSPLSRLQEGLQAPEPISTDEATDRDFWLDLWMSQVVGPRLGLSAPCLLYDFPASQAALARIRTGNPPVAERFELFWKGIELANGFHELTDAAEQAARFEQDLDWRRSRSRPTPPADAHLLAALRAGMPDGAGVALGVDRLLALLLGLPAVAQAMSFAGGRA